MPELNRSKDVHYVQTKTPLLTPSIGPGFGISTPTGPAMSTTPGVVQPAPPRSALPCPGRRWPIADYEQICKDRRSLFLVWSSLQGGTDPPGSDRASRTKAAPAAATVRPFVQARRAGISMNSIQFATAGSAISRKDRDRKTQGAVSVKLLMKCEADPAPASARSGARSWLDDSRPSPHRKRHSKCRGPAAWQAACARVSPRVFVSVDAHASGARYGRRFR